MFGCTLLILALHPLEWFKIRSYRQTAPSGLNADAGLGFLTKGLDLESYYYLFVLAFLLAFYREPLLLAIVLVMAVAHVAARRDVSHAPSVLRNGKHVAGMLAFDILEIVFLVFLISEFWSLIGVAL
jgi:hypothetical protein